VANDMAENELLTLPDECDRTLSRMIVHCDRLDCGRQVKPRRGRLQGSTWDESRFSWDVHNPLPRTRAPIVAVTL
jgi:hypothetical protein